jgi:hypothetical protein
MLGAARGALGLGFAAQARGLGHQGHRRSFRTGTFAFARGLQQALTQADFVHQRLLLGLRRQRIEIAPRHLGQQIEPAQIARAAERIELAIDERQARRALVGALEYRTQRQAQLGAVDARGSSRSACRACARGASSSRSG